MSGDQSFMLKQSVGGTGVRVGGSLEDGTVQFLAEMESH